MTQKEIAAYHQSQMFASLLEHYSDLDCEWFFYSYLNSQCFKSILNAETRTFLLNTHELTEQFLKEINYQLRHSPNNWRPHNFEWFGKIILYWQDLTNNNCESYFRQLPFDDWYPFIAKYGYMPPDTQFKIAEDWISEHK
jgi:hypothetical protein